MLIDTDKETNKSIIEGAKPVVRFVLAFILYARDPVKFSTNDAYTQADIFIDQLLRDL